MNVNEWLDTQQAKQNIGSHQYNYGTEGYDYTDEGQSIAFEQNLRVFGGETYMLSLSSLEAVINSNLEEADAEIDETDVGDEVTESMLKGLSAEARDLVGEDNWEKFKQGMKVAWAKIQNAAMAIIQKIKQWISAIMLKVYKKWADNNREDLGSDTTPVGKLEGNTRKLYAVAKPTPTSADFSPGKVSGGRVNYKELSTMGVTDVKSALVAVHRLVETLRETTGKHQLSKKVSAKGVQGMAQNRADAKTMATASMHAYRNQVKSLRDVVKLVNMQKIAVYQSGTTVARLATLYGNKWKEFTSVSDAFAHFELMVGSADTLREMSGTVKNTISVISNFYKANLSNTKNVANIQIQLNKFVAKNMAALGSTCVGIVSASFSVYVKGVGIFYRAIKKTLKEG